MPNATTVSIHNLSRDTRSRIKTSVAQIVVRTGYASDEGGRKIASKGGIMSVLTTVDHPGSTTVINALDGYGAQVSSIYRRTFSGGVKVSSVIKDIVGGMAGVTLGLVDVDASLGTKGLTISERSSSALDKLGDAFGFNWSVQNGVFQAIPDSGSLVKNKLISFRNRTLLSAIPILSGTANGPQLISGVMIKTLLDTSITPGTRITLQSEVSPELNKTYVAHDVTLDGQTHGDIWTTTINSYIEI